MVENVHIGSSMLCTYMYMYVVPTHVCCMWERVGKWLALVSGRTCLTAAGGLISVRSGEESLCCVRSSGRGGTVCH